MNWKLLLLVGVAIVVLVLLWPDPDEPLTVPLSARKIAVEGAVTLPIDLDVSEDLLRAVQVEEARVLSHGAETLSVLPLASGEGVETAVVRPRILVEGASVAGPASPENGSEVPSVGGVSRRVRVEGAETTLQMFGIGIIGFGQDVAPKITIENAKTAAVVPLTLPADWPELGGRD